MNAVMFEGFMDELEKLGAPIGAMIPRKGLVMQRRQIAGSLANVRATQGAGAARGTQQRIAERVKQLPMAAGWKASHPE